MDSFATIYERASRRKGGDQALEALLPKPAPAGTLERIADDRYLAEMTKAVFRSGFVWKIIENKWAGFEKGTSPPKPKSGPGFNHAPPTYWS